MDLMRMSHTDFARLIDSRESLVGKIKVTGRASVIGTAVDYVKEIWKRDRVSRDIHSNSACNVEGVPLVFKHE
jgi:hypothetical protein